MSEQVPIVEVIPETQWRELGIGEPETVTVKAERLILKVGTLECDLDFRGWGKVLFDGIPQKKITEMTIRIVAGQMPEVTMRVLPVPDSVFVSQLPPAP